MKDVAGPDEDWMTLPSGARVDVNRPDFSAMKSVEDYLELRCALQEKIIDIELQIDMFKVGAPELQGRKIELSWLPRATAAVKWAKLYRDECQTRGGMLTTKLTEQRHAARNATIGQRFIEAARQLLPAETYVKIGIVAGMFDE